MRWINFLMLILFFPFISFAQTTDFTIELPRKILAVNTPDGVNGQGYMKFYGNKTKTTEERCNFVLDHALLGTQMYGSYSGVAKSPMPSEVCTQTTEWLQSEGGSPVTLSGQCFNVKLVKDQKNANLSCYKIEVTTKGSDRIVRLLPLEMKRIQVMLSKYEIKVNYAAAVSESEVRGRQAPATSPTVAK